MNKRKRDLGPPPRWLNCPRKSIINDKFIAFKTPLDDSYESQVPDHCIFTPSMLLMSLASQKIKIGLWVDLTNTTRFYNRAEIEKEGIKYIKLQCRGHGECPSEDQTNIFIQLCQTFISKNPLHTIGVHCTHGFNRSGFLIAAYLVESMSWSVEAAVHAFSQARPPGIYKQDYLNELFRRYGDVSDVTTAPCLPDWCNEPDNEDDDGNSVGQDGDRSVGNNQPNMKRKREFHKKNPIFMEGVNGVKALQNDYDIAAIQARCQEMCSWKNSGFPGSQPVSMDLSNLKFLSVKPYFVSWKADGTRYMMLIDGPDKVYFIDRDNSVFKVEGLTFPRRKFPDQHLSNTLVDGEMIIDKVEGKAVPRYLVYDIIKFEGQEVGKADFERRFLCILREIVEPRIDGMKKRTIDRSKEPFSVRRKDFWGVEFAQQTLVKLGAKMCHEVDGLIFQPIPDPYISGRCPNVLKWKPPHMNSIDFKLSIQLQTGEGLLKTKIGYLYVGGLSDPFSQMKVTKDIKDLDKKIIECKYENNQWVFMRERTDKSFPNGYKTAIGVLESIRNPVTTEILFDFIDRQRYRPPVKT